jgi:biotin operon repressor
LLFGTEVAFAHQNLTRLTRWARSPDPVPEPVDEYLGLAALLSIGVRYYQRQPPLSLEDLAELLPSGDNLASRTIQMLQDCNLVVEVVSPGKKLPQSPQFLPNQPLDQLTVAEVLACLRRSREMALNQALVAEPGMAATLNSLLEARIICAEPSLTLKEVIESLGPAALPKGVV